MNDQTNKRTVIIIASRLDLMIDLTGFKNL